MPDDPQELRRINVTEAFPFTQLFRSFRLAIHPNKLILALIALLLTYVLGRIMDPIWPTTTVMPSMVAEIGQNPDAAATSEIRAYISLRGGKAFCDWREQAKDACEKRQAALLVKIKPDTTPDNALELAKDGRAADDIRRAAANLARDAEEILEGVHKAIDEVDRDKQQELYEAYRNVLVAVAVGPTKRVATEQARTSLDLLAKQKGLLGKEDKDVKEAKDRIAQAVGARLTARASANARGAGVFATLLEHEKTTFRKSVTAILNLNIGLDTTPPTGLKAAFVDTLGGIAWLFGTHWFYGVVFVIISLLIWSLFGGAICRIAALHAARDEKISFMQALKFGGRKLFSFFSAPLIPIALLVAIGAVVYAGGLFSAIPYVGEVFAGLFWPLALAGGAIMVLILIGTVGGFLLMFPTIAVEGSDSFDSLSRSFSYVYSKPWRTAFYVLVSGFYGAICYLFVRLFAHLALNATHMTAGLGMNVDGSSYLPETVGKLDAMWTRTSLLEQGQPFYGAFSQYPLGGTEHFCGFLITAWTYIIVGLLVAFTISFFFSASTLIYYLLRREVDATDIEDVYLEEYEEELAPVTTPPAPTETPDEPQDQGDSCQCGQAETCQHAEPPAEDNGEDDQEDKPQEGS